MDSEDKAAADTEKGKARTGAGPAGGKRATERSVGKGKVQEKGEAEARMQLNQQNLKSGKAEVGTESAKEKQLLKEEHGKGEAESEQAADSADHAKREGGSGDRVSKNGNSCRKEKHGKGEAWEMEKHGKGEAWEMEKQRQNKHQN